MNKLTSHVTTVAQPAPEYGLVPTDEQLMEMLQAGVREGMSLLQNRYARLLAQISGAVLHNESDVQDLLQEVFVEIWNHAARYEPAKGRPLGWIVTLTRRRAIDRLRRREAYDRAGDRLAEEADGRSQTWTHVHEEVAQHEIVEYVRRALAVLPDAQRDAIHFAYHRQMSQREIARQTGIPLGTVKTRLELGLKKMAVLLRGCDELLARSSCSRSMPEPESTFGPRPPEQPRG
jgi:RNA polymerase sigma-70 factor (ECF subfamily)